MSFHDVRLPSSALALLLLETDHRIDHKNGISNHIKKAYSEFTQVHITNRHRSVKPKPCVKKDALYATFVAMMLPSDLTLNPITPSPICHFLMLI